MTAAVAILLACAATFWVTLLFLVVAVATAQVRKTADGLTVKLASKTFATAIVLTSLGSIFALGLGIGSGWQS